MLNVKVIKSEPDKVINVTLHENDLKLVKEIRDKIGLVQSIKVFRLMANCTLLDAKNYNARLNELSAAGEVKASSNSNALVVIKHELISKKMNELGLNLRQGRARSTRTNPNAYGAGKAAGDRASFGRPGGAGGVRLIGRG